MIAKTSRITFKIMGFHMKKRMKLLLVPPMGIYIYMRSQETLEEAASPLTSPMSPGTQVQRKKLYRRYRQRLMLQIVLLLVICFAIILERIFYQIVVEWENGALASLQSSFGLSEKYTEQDGTVTYEPTGIVAGNGAGLYAYLGFFKVQFFILTHAFVTIYVAINAIVAAKLMYITTLVIYVVSLLQMFYAEARPFWQDSRVLASSCLTSYDHPSRSTAILCFFLCYAFYCFSSETTTEEKPEFDLRGFLIKLAVAILFIVVQLVNFLLGEQYLASMALGLVYFGTLFMLVVFVNPYIETAIRKSTVLTLEAKKYSFYWLLYLVLAETFAVICYSTQDYLLNIFWVQNFQHCTQYQNMQVERLRYDEIIGPWFTFQQTATMFALMGAVFGVPFCFRSNKVVDWYRGSIKKRLLRVLVANLTIIPSWLLLIFLQGGRTDESWISTLGINDFIIDAVHFFILYLWLFGFMPVYLLGKLLKLNNSDSDEYYVVMREEQQPSGQLTE